MNRDPAGGDRPRPRPVPLRFPAPPSELQPLAERLRSGGDGVGQPLADVQAAGEAGRAFGTRRAAGTSGVLGGRGAPAGRAGNAGDRRQAGSPGRAARGSGQRDEPRRRRAGGDRAPAPGEPRSSSVKPRSSSVEPRSSSVKPRSSSVKPRSSSVKPRSSSVKPRSSSGERRHMDGDTRWAAAEGQRPVGNGRPQTGRGGEGAGGAGPGEGGGARQRRPRLGVLIAIAVLAAVFLVVLHNVRDHHAPARAGGAHSRLTSVARHPKKLAPISVGIEDCTFVEQGVPTEDYATSTSVPYRRLVTEIRYPTEDGRAGTTQTKDATPAYSRGPFPWIVFAHGYNTTPDTYAALLDAWTRAGFVVVAPVFPDTSIAGVAAEHGANTEADDVYQPGDVAFVTRRVLAADRHGTGCPLVKGLLETKAIGLAGQSDGASTVAALAYGSAYRSLGAGLPYRAVAALSGQEMYDAANGSSDTYSHKAGDPALLVAQSDTDACNVPESSTLLYTWVANPDSWFLELLNVDHLPPYTGNAPASFAVVSKVTTQFFELELTGKQPGASLLATGNSEPGVAKMTAGLPAPDIAAVTPDAATCYDN